MYVNICMYVCIYMCIYIDLSIYTHTREGHGSKHRNLQAQHLGPGLPELPPALASEDGPGGSQEGPEPPPPPPSPPMMIPRCTQETSKRPPRTPGSPTDDPRSLSSTCRWSQAVWDQGYPTPSFVEPHPALAARQDAQARTRRPHGSSEPPWPRATRSQQRTPGLRFKTG